MPTPQEKVDAIQAKVDEQNRAKALQNVANVQANVQVGNSAKRRAEYERLSDTAQNPYINKLQQTSSAVTPLPNVYNPATATPWQQVGAQNLTNRGIDPTKLGTWVGENYQPYQAPTNWAGTKPTIATTDKPVIWTAPATTPKPWDFTTMTPEQLKAQYMAIGTKLPWEVTDEDRRFAKYLQTRIGLGETMDKIFGKSASSWTTTYSPQLNRDSALYQSSVRNPDGTYTVTYKDGGTQVINENPVKTVFPEWTPEYFAQKQAETNQAQIDTLTGQMKTEEERRKKETADLVAKYGENIAGQFASQKAEIEAQGAKRMDTLNTWLSFSGFWRSTLALDKRDEIAKNIETTITQAKAKADLELMAYRMEQEGADAEAISAMRTNIANVQANIDQANYENQLEIIKLNQENATSGAEAMNNLLSVISNSAEIEEDADLAKSAELGYFIDKKGNAMRDSQGRFMEFKGNSQTNLSPEEIEWYYNALKNKVINEKFLDDNLSIGDKNAIMKRAAVQDGSWVGTWFNPWSGDMRTDRHNNPVAMTTDVAKTLGLVEWVDYTVWDPFNTGKWRVLYTARLNGDGLQTTIKALDTAAKDPNKKAFYTQWGGQRWTYIGMSDEEWLSKSPEEKAQVIATMYKKEGGNGSINAGTFVVWGEGGGAGDAQPVTTVASTWYNQDLEQFYTKLNTSSSTIKMTAADWKTIDDMYSGKWGRAKFIEEAGKFKNAPKPFEQDFKNDLLRMVSEIYNVDRKMRVASDIPFAWTFSGEAADYNTTLESLDSALSFDQLVKLKNRGATFGSLTETEFKNIGKSILYAARTQTNEKYKQELKLLLKKLGISDQEIESALAGAGNTQNTTWTQWSPVSPSSTTPQWESDIFGSDW